MKQLSFLTFVFLLFSCKTVSKESDLANKTVVLFTDTIQSFNSNKLDSQYSFNYKFRNIGETPLKLEGFHSSCGCTVAELPKKLYKQNDTGSVTIYFNPAKDTGVIRKSVYIVCNTEQKLHQLIFEGIIKL